MSKNNNTQKIVGLGLFTAIVIVLQLMGSFIRFGTFSISLVLVPYIQSGDRALSSIYSAAFVGSALLVFFIFEAFIRRCTKGRA